jgi:glycosyltransferase involved in cell wall biosynthesis
MSSEFPAISILIPSFNQGVFIERTLLSILKQDYPGRVETIVSDGGSTDSTVEVLRKYEGSIIWWSAKDRGFADAVMKAAAKASGDLFAIQSSDDFYLAGAFRAAAAGFQRHPEVGFISGRDLGVDISGRVAWLRRQGGQITPRRILFGHPIGQHATFMRREVFEQVGGVRQDVDMCADLDLFYRASHIVPGRFIACHLGVYQIQPNQRTQTSRRFYPCLRRMVESCEEDPFYRERFKLSADEKRSLFAFWEISWTAVYDQAAAFRLARRLAPDICSFDPRTQHIIRKYSCGWASRIIAATLDGTLLASASGGLLRRIAAPDTDWWHVQGITPVGSSDRRGKW